MLRTCSRSTTRGIGTLAATLAVACVSPPVDGGPSADARLESVLEGAHRKPDGRLAREVRALSLDHPRHVPTLLADAALSMDEGRDERSIALLDAVLALEPANLDAVMLATRHAARGGDLAGAHRRLDAALRMRPDQPALYEGRASILFLEGRYRDALEALDRADALAGQESWRRAYHRGLITESLENFDEAEQHFTRCLELAPDFEPAIRRRHALVATKNSPRP